MASADVCAAERMSPATTTMSAAEMCSAPTPEMGAATSMASTDMPTPTVSATTMPSATAVTPAAMSSAPTACQRLFGHAQQDRGNQRRTDR